MKNLYFRYYEQEDRKFFVNGHNKPVDKGKGWAVHWAAGEKDHKNNFKTPSWKSWAGLNGWIETLSKNFKLSKDRIRVMLVFGDENLTAKKSVIRRLKKIHPFLVKGALINNVQIWLEKYPFLNEDEFVQMWEHRMGDVKSSIELNNKIRWNNNIKNDFINIKSEYRFKYFQWEIFKYEYELRYIFLKFGVFIKHKYIDQIREYSYIFEYMHEYYKLSNTAAIQLYCDYIINKKHPMNETDKNLISVMRKLKNNVKFFVDAKEFNKLSTEDMKKFIESVDNDREFLSIKDALRLGNSMKNIFPFQNKKERSLIEKDIQIPDNFKKYSWDRYIRKLNIPQVWRQYIKTGEKIKAEWAVRHIPQLSKSREMHGPNGSIATYHYHLVLRDMDSDMLVNGEKTSWRKVIGSLENKVSQQMKKQLGVNQPIPILYHAKFDGVKAITSSHQLRDEGDWMNHCVGCYIQACLDKKSYIYHVGQKAPKGATIEVCVNDDGKYILQQIYAYQDKPASKKDKSLAEQFVNHLNKGGEK